MEKKKKISTKQRIINEAIRLYNLHGAHNITSRHIAAELGISHGNLDYHYNNREAILLAIYKQMREEMSASYESQKGATASFEDFHLLLVHLESFHMKYRFFNMDVLEISRSYPDVSKLLGDTIVLRSKQMADFFERFLQDGYIDNSINPFLDRLQHTIRIVITFWLSQREVLTSFKFQGDGEMARHIWELIIPFMTDEGLKEFDRMIAKHGYSLVG
ncbi:TetR family transcriptional regulator [Echinicola strongylocentroti]|uniref:TetR family transcriptional regulator n=1 Tax=Echinicola strongylocentroti TaxID=1795355 RepID=A0A2Z4IJF6_9BACT|nr:TetR/AcrR family transcriptional regulator [Echinicola strongylocentroti]AWW30879.1 TetR family transcriptional regulator [Echinicola strongylocentroti]